MAEYKVVTIYGPTPGGPFSSLSNWSEVYYAVPGLGLDEYADFLMTGAGAFNFVRGRTVIMSPGWSLKTIKVYDTLNPRASVERNPNRKGAFIVESGTDNDEQPYDRLLWRFNTPSTSRWARIGAIPRKVVNAGGVYQGGDPPVTAVGGTFHQLFMNQFIPSLQNNDIAMRHVTPLASTRIWNLYVADVANIKASPRAPVISIKNTDVAEPLVNHYLKIVNAHPVVGLNGLWFASKTSVEDTFTYIWLRPKKNVSLVGSLEAGASFQTQLYTYPELSSGSPKRGVSRKPGRPFDLPRGRASTRRK